MDDEHFGSCLRRAREQRALTIGMFLHPPRFRGPRSRCSSRGRWPDCRRMSCSRLHPFVRQSRRHQRRQAAGSVRSRRQREDGGRARGVRGSGCRSGAGRGVPEEHDDGNSRREPGPRGVRAHFRAHRDDHAVAAAPPPAPVGRRAEHGSGDQRTRRDRARRRLRLALARLNGASLARNARSATMRTTWCRSPRSRSSCAR